MIPKQFRIHAVLIIACLFMIVFPMFNEQPPDADKAKKATAAALEFLSLIDADKYAESWEVAAALVKEKVSRDEWVEKRAKARSLSGPLIERTENDVSYSTTAKGGPDGEYIMLSYDAKYQKAPDITENVIVMLEGRQWKVAGYIIQ